MSPTTDTRASVLVVDDEEAVVDLYAEWLREDFDVTAVSSGEEALEALHPGIHVVLLDRNMPSFSGDDVLVTLRDRGLHCRVVLVTGERPETDVVDLGFDDYLRKPVDPDDLVEAVERHQYRDPIEDLRNRLSSLRVRRNIMELENSEESLSSADGYRQLCSRIEHLDEQLATRRDTLARQTSD